MLKNYIANILTIVQSKLLKSISFVLVANIIAAGAGFVSSVITLRSLGTEGVGILYPLIGVMMIFSQFGDLGVSTAFIKLAGKTYLENIEKSHQYFNAVLKLKLILAVIGTALCLLFSTPISIKILDSAQHSNLVKLMSFGVFFQIMSHYFSSSLQVEGKFKTLAFFKAFPPLVKVVLLVILLQLGKFTLFNVLLATLIVPFLANVIGVYSLNKTIFRVQADLKQYFNEIYLIARWIFISAVASSLMGQTDILMLRSMAGSSAVEQLLGGLKLASVLPVVTTAFLTVVLPKVLSMKSHNELNYFYRKSLLSLPVLFFIGLAAIPLSSYLIPIVLGEKFNLSISVFRIYFIGFLLEIFITPMSSIIYHINKEKLFVILNIVQLILNIVVNYLLIPFLGADGAAYGTFATKVLGVVFILLVLFQNLVHKPKVEI
jgi:O-antigen/teichoic acid export membrane protein